MKKLLITTALVASISTSAFAFSGNTYNEDNSTTNNPVANGGSATQGQAQGINSRIEGSIRSSNKNYNAAYDNSKTSQTSLQGNVQKGGDVTVEGDSYEAPDIPVNSAIAVAPIPTSDCLGSVGIGGQGINLAGALGFTTQSEPCNIRENAKVAAGLVGKDAAYLILCSNDDIRTAWEGSKKACPSRKEESYTTNWAGNSSKGRIQGSVGRR